MLSMTKLPVAYDRNVLPESYAVPMDTSHLPDVSKLLSSDDNGVKKYFGKREAHFPTDQDSLKSFFLASSTIQNDVQTYVLKNPTDAFIGLATLSGHMGGCREIGYILHPDYRKQGLFPKALLSAIHHQFEQFQFVKEIFVMPFDGDEDAIPALKYIGFENEEPQCLDDGGHRSLALTLKEDEELELGRRQYYRITRDLLHEQDKQRGLMV
jgi:RimJ/RimL family protein N-acetyltransferase